MKLIIAPNPIFKKKAVPVEVVDERVRALVAQMFDVLYKAEGIGLGANMVGLLERIVVIDHKEGAGPNPKAYINPILSDRSEEMQSFTEASLSYPGISADITRPKEVTVHYLDLKGDPQTERLEGWPAAVIQHEIDYLDGVIYLDHLSATKRNMLMRKYNKLKNSAAPLTWKIKGTV